MNNYPFVKLLILFDMKILILQFWIVFCVFGYSQTKLISHKSHSGSNENFRIAFENNLFDIENSNFGEMRYDVVDVNITDSVVKISENKIVVFSTEYTERYNRKTQKKCSKDERTRLLKDTIIIVPKSKRKGITEKEARTKIDSIGYYKKKSATFKYNGFDKKQKNKKSIFGFWTDFPDFPTYSLSILLIGFLLMFTYMFGQTLRSKTKISF